MPRNKLSDLTNHLFEQLERLNDAELSGEELESEARRARAMVGMAEAIQENARISITAARLASETGATAGEVSALLTGGSR